MSKIKLDYDKIIINPDNEMAERGKQYYASTGIVSLANAISSDYVVTLIDIDTTELNCFKVKNKYNAIKSVSILYPAKEYTFNLLSTEVYYCLVSPSPKDLKPFYSSTGAIIEAKRLKSISNSSDKVRVLKAMGTIEEVEV